MKKLLLIPLVLTLLSCGATNLYTSAALTKVSSDSVEAINNIKRLDDMKFKAWVEAAGAISAGALSRNNTGNNEAVKAVLLLCPVKGNLGVQ